MRLLEVSRLVLPLDLQGYDQSILRRLRDVGREEELLSLELSVDWLTQWQLVKSRKKLHPTYLEETCLPLLRRLEDTGQ